jgi:hypothetical protein
MVSPPAARREGEGIEGSAWREPHHTSSAPYGAEFSFSLSPRPYSGGISSRGPPPPYHYDYYGSSSNNDGPPPPPHRGPPPGNEYWMSPPPPPPPPNRGPPPGNEYWMSPPPYQHMPHPSQQQHQHRSPSRRGPPYGGPGDHHLFQQKQHGHQRKDFSPPAPAAPVGQSPTTRGVQVTVSASADSEESLRPSLKQDGGRGRSNDAGDNHDDDDNDNDNDVIMGNESESVSKQGKKEKGDPLSVLADVSAGMGGKNKQGKQKDAADNSKKSDPDSASEENATSTSTTNAATASRPPPVPMPAPTSPLQRRMKPSPITPSQTLKKILSIVAPNGHHLREDSTNLLHPADHMNLHRLLKVEVDHHNNPWYHLAGNHPLYRMEIVGVAMLVAVVENCILLIIQNILVLPSRVVVVVVVLVVVYTTLHRAAATSTSTADLVVCAMEVV